VFDANVLISGLVFEGVPGRCLSAMAAGQAQCVTCAAILRDVADKLGRKFGHSESELGDELGWIAQHAETVEPSGELTGVCRDSDDDLVLECAIVGNAAYIVTGDLDLLDMRDFRGGSDGHARAVHADC
jgi:putative PIN family toxin of toxin-antitoxin system